MEPRSLKYVAECSLGELTSGSPEQRVGRVATDSRRVTAGDLFVALTGERFDGHGFVAEAVGRGATAILVERDRLETAPPGVGMITVPNARRALGRLAARYRRDFELPCIAVGGSNGKTTTKELIAAVLSQRFNVLKSEGSFNNDVGVPLTLLNLDESHAAAVFEVGTNHPGELAPLLWMVQPRYGVITNIGREHLEFFGDLAGVAEEEGWLAELLAFDGRLFVNGDSPCMDQVLRRARARVVRVGMGAANDWWVRDLQVAEAGTTFNVQAPTGALSGEYRISLLGRHQVVNALLALAVGAELGLDRRDLSAGLLACQSPKMRLQLREVNGVRLLDDAYNANADSTVAALETLRDLPCPGRRVAVLGDMAELGEESASAHAEVGRRAAELGVEHLFAVGKMAPVMGHAARNASLAEVHEFPDVGEAGPALREFVRAGDVVLVKASRAARLERVSEMLEGGDAKRH